jgi:WD40 repeat protein
MKFILWTSVLLWTCSGLSQTLTTLTEFPSPTRSLQDEKKFNAVRLGPGNTMTVQQTPPDFQLDSFDFSPDGNWTFMTWASGRLEVRDSETGKRIAQFNPTPGPVFEANYNDATKQLLVTSQHGLIRLVDPHSGKLLREIHTEVGRLKYDLQKVIIAQDGSWIAYVNEDNGKVLDLKSEPPKILADLENAYDVALTRDGAELWLINREKIFGLKTNSWSKIASSPLLDSVQPTGTPTLALASIEGGTVAFVPSQSGLLRYELKTMSGRKVTTNPSYWVGSDTARNEVLVNERQAFSLYEADGTLRCQWKQFQHQTIKVSGNGKWLGNLIFGRVDLWPLDSLSDSCTSPKH